MDSAAYLAAHGVGDALHAAVKKVLVSRPDDPLKAIAAILLAEDDPAPPPAVPPPTPASNANDGVDKFRAAATIAGYLKCMNAKLKISGRGEQNAEMLMVHRANGTLVIEDYGGWALRNESMSRMLRELDAAGALPKEFPPLCIQTGDRCIIKRTSGESEDGVELHLWQSQPVDDELRARLPLRRVLSMCSTPKYADVAIPDWCFDAWPEAGVAQGQYDEACASLALAGAAAPSSPQKVSWAGTVHHHPSRMRLVEMAKAHPDRFAVNAIADRTLAEEDGATTDATNHHQQQQQQQQHRTLIEQVGACGYLLDVQGKGYSSRLKLLLHSGRCVFYARRPWQEYYTAALTPWVHYVPVSEDLSDLIDRLDWADANPKKVLAIGKAARDFAKTYLTKAAAMAALAKAISDGTAADDAWRVGPSEVSSSAANGNDNGGNGHGGEEGELRRGDWASNRASYDAVRMYYRWTFMPVSKDRRRPLSLLASRGVTDLTDRDVYTFGVYTGASLKFWFDNFDAIGVTTGPHWGFDSFEGLPEETDGMELECKAWLPGSFSAADQFGVYTFGEVEKKILEHVGEAHAHDTRLIKGFFSDALTGTLKAERQMQPACLVDVDVDLYISCYQCLDWMFAQGLMVSGTIVYYDDVSIVKADGGGELRAHNELTLKYDVKWRKLHDSCWVVTSIGGLRAGDDLM